MLFWLFLCRSWKVNRKKETASSYVRATNLFGDNTLSDDELFGKHVLSIHVDNHHFISHPSPPKCSANLGIYMQDPCARQSLQLYTYLVACILLCSPTHYKPEYVTTHTRSISTPVYVHTYRQPAHVSICQRACISRSVSTRGNMLNQTKPNSKLPIWICQSSPLLYVPASVPRCPLFLVPTVPPCYLPESCVQSKAPCRYTICHSYLDILDLCHPLS